MFESGGSKPASAAVRPQWRYGGFRPAKDNGEECTLLVFATNRTIDLYMVYHGLKVSASVIPCQGLL